MALRLRMSMMPTLIGVVEPSLQTRTRNIPYAEVPIKQFETVYRAMHPESGESFLQTGKMPASARGETMISPTLGYITGNNYRGSIFEINLRLGTMQQLENIGVRDNAIENPFSRLPPVGRGWMNTNAYFKVEKTNFMGYPQVNIGLGRGAALNIFNSNVINIKKIK